MGCKNTDKMEKKIALIMRIGVFFSALIMIFGFAMLLFNGPNINTDISSYSVFEVLEGLWYFNPYSYMLAGIFVLILTPIIRVVSCIISFAIQKDKMYTTITLTGLIILIASIIIGILSANNFS